MGPITQKGNEIIVEPELSLTVDGKRIVCRAGTTILDAALMNSIKIPTLCHHKHLSPTGACRLCIVEETTSGRIYASCVTPVAANMSVQTDSPTLKRYRRNIIRLMMANHPESCIVCDQGNRCELRKHAADLGVGLNDLYPMPHFGGFEAANPFMVRDLSKCILCGRCIRADHELVVVGAIDYDLRGFLSKPHTLHNLPLQESSCTFCGTCVSLCPTGALVAKSHNHVGSPNKVKTSVCGFCGVVCSIEIGCEGDQIVEVNPSHKDDSINGSTLCIRGHFANDFLYSPKRLTRPLIRKDDQLCSVSWEEALAVTAEKLRSIKEKNGSQSLALFGSSKCSLEENYVFQKFARIILETNNVDNGGYLWGRSTINSIHQKLDGGGCVLPLNTLERAEAIIVIGANPTHSLPVVGYYLKRASRKKGIPLIIIDPRKTEMVPFSSTWLSPKPQTDSQLIHGLAAIVNRRNTYDAPFIERYTLDSQRYFESLSSLDVHQISQLTGVPLDTMNKAASVITGRRTAFVIGHGILQQRNGLQALEAILNLALMTGNIGKKGTGLFFLMAENNGLGAWDMGTAPDFLPGRHPLTKEDTRKYWEQAWKTRISPDPGLNIIRMIQEAEEGSLKALYVMGENPVRSLPQPGQIRKALGNLEFLVVQDILQNETTQMADVVLPGAAFSEKEGSFTNMEGRIQSFAPVVTPPGEAKPDSEILGLLAEEMGYPFKYRSIEDLRDEISRLTPSYSEIGKEGTHAWVTESSRLALFHPDGEGDLIHFSEVTPISEEPPDRDYPLKALLGSVRHHLGSGTRTSCSGRISEFDRQGDVEISPEDSKRLGIVSKDKVRISSPYGKIVRRAKVVKNQKSGYLFSPRAVHKNDARNLLALTSLEEKHSPGLMEINVRIERA